MAQIPEEIQSILRELEAAGFSAYLVGGCVRDLLRGAEPADWDAAGSARPEQVLALFGAEASPTGLRHGTVTIRRGGSSLELTTFRRDGDYCDGRHPDSVCFTDSLTEDLARRDFTLGAMALSVRGERYDPFGGAEDLRHGLLRCVGAPRQRFAEDALRILRGLRFASTLGLRIEAQTAQALHDERERLRQLAPERVRAELEKLLCGANAGQVLREYPDVLGVWLPELLPMVRFDQRNRHHCYDVWEHTIHALQLSAPLPVLRWTLLLHDVGKPICFTEDVQGGTHYHGHPKASYFMSLPMLDRLRMEHRLRDPIALLIRWHDRSIPRSRSELLHYLHDLGEENLRLLLAVKRADNLAQHPDYWGRQALLDESEENLARLLGDSPCYRLEHLAVKGEDLLRLGLRGSSVGQALQGLLLAVMDGECPNERAALLRRLAEASPEGDDW